MSKEMKREEKIRVVYVEAEKEAKVIEMENSLEEMQAKVGGLITTSYYFDDPVAIVSNDEGWLMNMPPNRAIYNEHTGEMVGIIPGNFFVCYAPAESEYFHSLPQDLLEKYEKKFKYPELFFKAKEGVQVISLEPEKKKRDRREDRR